MEIKIEQKGPRTISVNVTGRLDAATSPELEKRLTACFGEGTIGLILNFAELEYISSAGLRVLIFAAKKMKSANGSLALCGLQEYVREVIEIAGFMTILQILPNEEQALAAVGRALPGQGV
jgi:anti-sigma B factor antagonist